MPSNPMQRKVRNSFLLGVLVMLIIAILIGVFKASELEIKWDSSMKVMFQKKPWMNILENLHQLMN